MFKTVAVTPTVIQSRVEVNVSTSGSIVIEPQMYTDIRSYNTDAEEYTGEYEFTPSQTAQEIDIEGKIARSDIGQ